MGPAQHNIKNFPVNPVPIYVSWSTPSYPFIKLKADGSALPNPGTGGIGSVFRNFEGLWIIGFAQHFPHLTNLQAEILAIKVGLQIVLNKISLTYSLNQIPW